MRAYLGISGAIFGLIALLHILRVVLDWSAQIGTWTVPFWVSWIAIFVSGGLCVWAFRLFQASRPVS